MQLRALTSFKTNPVKKGKTDWFLVRSGFLTTVTVTLEFVFREFFSFESLEKN